MHVDDAGSREGGRATCSAVTECLHFAATPTFTVMALLNGIGSMGAMDMLCPAAHGGLPLGGMTMMYVLMAAFHAAPWLKGAPRWWRAMRPARPQARTVGQWNISSRSRRGSGGVARVR